jgi:colanic acid/amylovoran biosynthesis glycosyltransferase
MKKIFLFTHSFPYSKVGESFIEVEMLVASKLDFDITIVPMYSLSVHKNIPDNIKILPDLINIKRLRRFRIFLTMFLDPLFFGLFIHKKSIYSKLTNFYNAFKYLYGGLLIKDFLLSNKGLFPEGSVLYSFWFNYTALGFALAFESSEHYRTCKFYSRAHRYDLYAEEEGIFIPYREKTLSCLENVFSGSDDGVKFLSSKYPQYSEKTKLGRLGVLPVEIKNKNKKKSDISLISCSNVVPVKRVDLIYDSIRQFCESYPNYKVSWIHIGDGVEMPSLQQKIKSTKPENLYAKLPGYMQNSDLLELLGTNEFDAFINLSLSEGLPVTLMMSISAAIPLIATDAGGSKEIVTKETGCLLPISFSPAIFSDSVLYCKDNHQLRESALSFYFSNFSAIKNYTEFYKNL